MHHSTSLLVFGVWWLAGDVESLTLMPSTVKGGDKLHSFAKSKSYPNQTGLKPPTPDSPMKRSVTFDTAPHKHNEGPKNKTDTRE